jgi:hypothetical protein
MISCRGETSVFMYLREALINSLSHSDSTQHTLHSLFSLVYAFFTHRTVSV